MKSIKTKLILCILAILIISSVSTIVLGFSESFKVTNAIIETQVEDKLAGANNMLQLYLADQFGSFRLNEAGTLVGERSDSLEGQYEYIDRLAEEMNVVATIFTKDGSNFTRLLTTIKDEQGKRTTGTQLDTSGAAYQAITQGSSFLGEASILGQQYMTVYAPIFAEDSSVIGIYFVGVPMEKVNAIFQEGKTSMVGSVSILCLAVFLFATAFTFFFVGRIVRPIKKMTEAAQEIADGNFDVQLSVKAKDEVGQLAKAFERTIGRLVNYQGYIDEISDALRSVSQGNLTVTLKKEYEGQFKKVKDNLQALLFHLNATIQQISESAEQVDGGAVQVSNAAQALSQGATEQASATEELSAFIGQVAEQIQENASHAQQAHERALFAGEELQTSNRQMQDMMEAMEQINTKSAEISTIIKMIDDIAFQTNILALNAAVEAARAGTAGKGFAVVADEVRNLAGKSAVAVKDTTALIQSTITAVGSGAQIAKSTAESLHKSADVTNQSVALIDQIARATQEQATAIAQINQGIEQISSVVQTNAATAEESAAASEELSAQSNLLKEMIHRFQLIDAENIHNAAQGGSLTAAAHPTEVLATAGAKY